VSRIPPNAAIRPTNGTLRRDGAQISYLSLGSGPSVVVVPGALSVAADYLAFARALSDHFTVHIIERRRRGHSSPQGEHYGNGDLLGSARDRPIGRHHSTRASD